jgi:hypothetical protein
VHTHVIRRTNGRVRQLSPIRLPGRDIPFTRHLEIDRIHHDAVPDARLAADIGVGRRIARDVSAAEQSLVVGGIVLFVESGGEAEIGKLDVASAVDEDVVGLDVTDGRREVRPPF